MLALVNKGEPPEAYAAFWAPFVAVGEGASHDRHSPLEACASHGRAPVPKDFRRWCSPDRISALDSVRENSGTPYWERRFGSLWHKAGVFSDAAEFVGC
jgi:hypothetical protein